jgi:hypothetical protein
MQQGHLRYSGDAMARAITRPDVVQGDDADMPIAYHPIRRAGVSIAKRSWNMPLACTGEARARLQYVSNTVGRC